MFKTKSLLISGISLLITIVMMVTLCSVGFTASAGETIDAWDGTAATSFAGGDGSEENPFKIENGGQLYKMVSEFSNTAVGTKPTSHTYFRITKDINLNGKQWYDIGKTSYPSNTAYSTGFSGIIYGDGHKITGLYTNKVAGATGLIPIATQGAEIHDLHLENGDFKKTAWNAYSKGAFIGLAVGAGSSKPIIIEGCSVKNFEIVAKEGAAAFVGYTYSQSFTIENCYCENVDVSITATSSANAGAFLGRTAGSDYGNTIIIRDSHCAEVSPTIYWNSEAFKSITTFTNVYTCNEAYDSSITGVTKLTASQMTGAAAKTNMPGLDWTVWETTENGYPTLTAPEVVECQHENEEDGEKTEATYFTKGSKQILCADCGEFIRNDEIDYDTTNPVIFDDAVLDPATNKLTVAWTYSEALNEDIKAAATKGLAVKFAFGDKEYTVPNTVLNTEGGSVTIEGINADRFNKELTVKLEFAIGDYNTEVLNGAAIYTVAVNTTVSNENQAKADAYTGLINAIANATEAVVEGAGTGSADFTAEDSSVDIKAGTATFKFVATDKFVDEVTEKGTANRTVKLVVTVDGENHEVTINQLKTSIKVTIKGLSFEQMYGSVSAKLVITYSDDSSKNIDSQAVTFNFKDNINNSDNTVAEALEALLKN